MKPAKLILLFCVLKSSLSLAQPYTISGFIEDSVSGERLIGANLYDNLSKKGTTTNTYGFYSLTLQKGEIELLYSFVGYQSHSEKFSISKDTIINIGLSASLNLKEVQVIASKAEEIQNKTQMSSINIPMDKVENLPNMMGERDVMKTIQLMPGVQSGGELSSSVYVRGGGPDQNLILLDGVPIYNASHLFGFLSIFNSDAINSATLIKGGFPARYGGRLSSVIDIRMKEGNNKKIHGAGSVGMLSSKLTLEGPIKSGKTTFLISGRRIYMDLYTRLILALTNKKDEKISAGTYFYDVNAKVNHKFSDKDRLYLSSYFGNAKFFFKNTSEFSGNKTKLKSAMEWGNVIGALRWNHIFNNKLFSNLTLNYSRYRFVVGYEAENSYKNGLEKDIFQFEYKSGIQDWTGKWEFDYFPTPNHSVKFGINETYHHFFPGVNLLKLESNSEFVDTTYGEKNQYSHEPYIFVEDEMTISNRLKATIGIHGSGFILHNKYYYSIQPRLASRFLISEKTSIKGAYSYMSQYLHLLTNPSIGLPTDLWVPVTKNIPPQNSHQFALGIAGSISKFLEASFEGYYKSMSNLISYKDGASFNNGTNWEKKVEIGKGQSYGAEFLLEKKVGKTSGWIGYTLSWTNRQFENINFGKSFPYRYDRRHDIGIALYHKFNKKYDVGIVWVYGTGKAVTLGTKRYNIPEMNIKPNPYPDSDPEVSFITSRNNYREPAYHRLDICGNSPEFKKWGEGNWNISIYNLYVRQNPFYLFFKRNPNSNKLKLYQSSLLPFMVSFSYSFKF